MTSYTRVGSGRSRVEGESYIGQYRRLESIGKGSFATVYRAIHPADGTLLAIKTVVTGSLSSKLKNNLTSEIDILKSIKHPHIVALVQCLESSTHIHLIMEFCQLGDLATFVKKRDKLAAHPITAEMMRNYPNPLGQGFNEVVVRHFAKQLSAALEFMRSKNIMHRDLKPQNLLLNPPAAWIANERPENRPHEAFKGQLSPTVGIASLPVLKIADFGFARHLPTTTLAETLCGSPLYMAPEILRYEKYDAKADLWSVGTVLHELIVGRPPFRATNHVDLLRKVEMTADRIKFPDDLTISNDMKTVIRGLLKRMPTERISWESFFLSPIITDAIPGLVPSDQPKVSPSPAMKEELPLSPGAMDPGPSTPGPSRYDSSTPMPLSERRPSGVSAAVVAGSPKEKNKSYFPEEPKSRLEELKYRPLVQRTASATPAPLSAMRPISSPSSPKRPGLVGHPTAPDIQGYRQERTTADESGDGKDNVVVSPSPSERDQNRQREYEQERERERERRLKREQTKAARDARERAAQDVAFERDYVMVEKRAVEVNAFADQLAANPQVTGIPRSLPTTQPGSMTRRVTTQTVPSSIGMQQNSPGRHVQVAGRNEGSQGRRRSLEPKPLAGKISATSAIAAALNNVNFRFAGAPFFPSLGKNPSSPAQPYPAFPSLPITHASTSPRLGYRSRAISMDKDPEVISALEETATRSDVVYGFAEVKHKQLIPITPSNENRIGYRGREQAGRARPEEGVGRTGQDGYVAEHEDLTTEAIVEIAEEALALYAKCLAIVNNVFLLAGRWHTHKMEAIAAAQLSLSPRSADNNPASPTSAHAQRFNNVVQWCRTRYNECLQKVEYSQRRLQAAQVKLPISHHGHPSHHLAADTNASDDAISASTLHMTTGVTAEKLMYERALDMSKTAAVNELMGQDLPGCELAYNTAVRLLEGVLEQDQDDVRGIEGKDGGEEELAPIPGIEGADVRAILEVLASTQQRLAGTRAKMAARARAR